MLAHQIETSVRDVVYRTRGRKRGPITRLVSPSDFGELMKPFVFLDLAVFDGEERIPMDQLWHPHSGIATVTVILDGAVRIAVCQLYGARSQRVIRRNLAEFLISGLRYVFPGQLGEIGRGMPTSILGSPALSARFFVGDDVDEKKLNVVWPAEGDAARVRGSLP